MSQLFSITPYVISVLSLVGVVFNTFYIRHTKRKLQNSQIAHDTIMNSTFHNSREIIKRRIVAIDNILDSFLILKKFSEAIILIQMLDTKVEPKKTTLKKLKGYSFKELDKNWQLKDFSGKEFLWTNIEAHKCYIVYMNMVRYGICLAEKARDPNYPAPNKEEVLTQIKTQFPDIPDVDENRTLPDLLSHTLLHLEVKLHFALQKAAFVCTEEKGLHFQQAVELLQHHKHLQILI